MMLLVSLLPPSCTDQSSADNAKTVGLMAEDFAKKGWHFAQKQQARGASVGPGGTGGVRHYSTFTGGFPGTKKTTNSELKNWYSNGATSDSLMALMTGDAGSFPPHLQEVRQKLTEFMEEYVFPNEKTVLDHQLSSERWTPLPLVEELKVRMTLTTLFLLVAVCTIVCALQSKARSRGLWNLFLPLESDPDCRYGAGLTNLEYAHLAEIMGQSIFASEVRGQKVSCD